MLLNSCKYYCKLCKIFNNLSEICGWNVLAELLMDAIYISIIFFRENKGTIELKDFRVIWLFEPLITMTFLVYSYQSIQQEVNYL